MNLRLETENDYKETEHVTREAFWNVYRPGCNEHLILHRLRKSSTFIKDLDYVVEEKGIIIGNIIYTKMIKEGNICENIIAFGPVSVLPKFQNQGIGSLLITKTLQRSKDLGFKAVLITGNPKYYKKFGFISASKYSIHLPNFSIDDEAVFFMVKELEDGYLMKHSGTYSFDTNFDSSDLELENFEKQFPYKKKRDSKPSDL
ncbi:GNAT family N-acetyltransferase [Anaerosacchariphilus polymeriproducens]|uniref:N-acetyltransferase n=1 Tax=Anaerosacchariphilus polymeriproducens TaxID=1812858 RepID=A0A371B010_9FIRM|nr:N-acetyltransferase [Anaerosacchariphilus polymeriproducens]RDU25184.1 N-acetyltransferase [Anaerosacchariphilus polymeriproducens]